MQAIMETGFDVIYLFSVVTLGVLMVKGSKGNKQFLLFGVMAILLGLGDAFHLVPRMWALNTTGVEAHVVALGFGKLVTSVTMTAFYMMLYYVWRLRYKVQGKLGLDIFMFGLAAARIGLCFFPQNQWLSADAPLSWGIYRNIPFLIMGLIIIVLFFIDAKKANDKAFRFMWLAISLSFAFYIPVVLWADKFPLLGLLMIPKTCAYVWVVWMGYSDMKKNSQKKVKAK